MTSWLRSIPTHRGADGGIRSPERKGHPSPRASRAWHLQERVSVILHHCPETCVRDRQLSTLLVHSSSNARGAPPTACHVRTSQAGSLLWHFHSARGEKVQTINQETGSFQKARSALGDIKQAGEIERDQVWSGKPSLRR